MSPWGKRDHPFLSFSLEQGSGAPSLRPAERAVSRGELRGGVRPAAQPEHEAGHRGWEAAPGRGLGLSRPGGTCDLASFFNICDFIILASQRYYASPGEQIQGAYTRM